MRDPLSQPRPPRRVRRVVDAEVAEQLGMLFDLLVAQRAELLDPLDLVDVSRKRKAKAEPEDAEPEP